VTRNPAYEDIKASIRERGLDAPPAITRRPGEPHYIIRNGGNTRLAILRELWSETKDGSSACLFRPWPQRGEVCCRAENELRGGLSFIERALGVEKAREFYEQEGGQALSQSELARRLTADGFPLPQSHISRMQDAVHYLLPAIPTLLYGGLGRHQVERLAVLRKACERTWERRALGRTCRWTSPRCSRTCWRSSTRSPTSSRRSGCRTSWSARWPSCWKRTTTRWPGDRRQRKPPARIDQRPAPLQAADLRAGRATATTVTAFAAGRSVQSSEPGARASGAGRLRRPVPRRPPATSAADAAARRAPAGHIVSPAPTTERLQSIQRMVADQMGDKLPDFEADALRAIPVQAGGLYPISDVWYIEPGLDVPDRLRVHIAQFAREIAEEADVAGQVEPSEGGIGFVCVAPRRCAHCPFARAVLTCCMRCAPRPTRSRLGWRAAGRRPGGLLHGGGAYPRLSDAGLVKLFRLLRLARRLLDLEPARPPATWPRRRGGHHVGTASAQPGRHRPGAA
jgi:ParB family protein of integrating conjugative element (PFGI_1 class)